MATSGVDQGFIEAVANEVSFGIEIAVGAWMARIESALEDPRLTTLGRLRAVQQVVSEFKRIAGPADSSC